MAEQDEQLEAFKQWWKKNWPSLVLGIGLALLIVAGWQYWQNKQAADAAAARQGFDTVISALQNPDPDERESTLEMAVNSLQNDYASSSYAVFASLVAASHYMEQGNPQEAVAQLEWANERAEGGSMLLVIQKRLARAHLDAGNEDAALAVLDGVDSPGKFEPLLLEIRGDIHRIRGEQSDAREAYQRARDLMDEESRDRLLALKLADLAGEED